MKKIRVSLWVGRAEKLNPPKALMLDGDRILCRGNPLWLPLIPLIPPLVGTGTGLMALSLWMGRAEKLNPPKASFIFP
jgi:hypothetical protein